VVMMLVLQVAAQRPGGHEVALAVDEPADDQQRAQSRRAQRGAEGLDPKLGHLPRQPYLDHLEWRRVEWRVAPQRQPKGRPGELHPVDRGEGFVMLEIGAE